MAKTSVDEFGDVRKTPENGRVGLADRAPKSNGWKPFKEG